MDLKPFFLGQAIGRLEAVILLFDLSTEEKRRLLRPIQT
jgi:hypothetical protein